MKQQGKWQMAKGKWQTVSAILFLTFALCHLPFALPLQAANVSTSPLSGARAYPNPWRVDRHANTDLKFDTIPPSSLIKIFTVSGREVKQLMADSTGTAVWNRRNDSGDSVASGVYIYLIIDPQGNETSGKLAVIK